jgi:hypothetical protein
MGMHSHDVDPITGWGYEQTDQLAIDAVENSIEWYAPV